MPKDSWDAITFVAQKKMKVLGVGIYGQTENKKDLFKFVYRYQIEAADGNVIKIQGDITDDNVS